MSEVKLREKIGYALGDAAAGGITWKVMSIAFPLFFTNVFGLTVADTATLMLIARMFDVITDPLMGSLADRTMANLRCPTLRACLCPATLYPRPRRYGQTHLGLYALSADDGGLYCRQCALRIVAGRDD